MSAVWILVSSLLFATMSVLVKIASVDHSLAEIVFFRSLPGAVALLCYARIHRLQLYTPLWRIHSLRNLAGLTSMTLSFFAISKLALSTAACLEYTAPIFMMLYVVVASKRRLGALHATALIVGFGGVLLLLQPTLQANQTVPFAAGLTSGGLAAIAYMQIRRLGRAGEASWRTVLIFSLATMTLALIAMPFSPPAVYTARGLAILLAIGVTGLFAQLTMTRAFSHGVPMLVATLQYSTVVFAVIYGFFFWGDRLSTSATLGLLAVTVSGIVAARGLGRNSSVVVAE